MSDKSEPRVAALSLFVERLEARSKITRAERNALLDLPGDLQPVKVHEEFVRLGEGLQHSCLVANGLVARFAQLEDGRRQIVGLYLPGDMVDLYSLMLPAAPSPLQALTASAVVRVPHAALRALAFEYNGIAAALWRDCVVDGGIVAQWLVNVGRRSARERTAHLFCEMTVRYGLIGQVQGNRYVLPMTQEQIADALGMTPVHVNRSLKVLREEGLLQFVRGQVTILDWPRLRQAAEFEDGYIHPLEPDRMGRRSGC